MGMGNRWVIGMGWGSGDGFQGWVTGVGYRDGMGQRGTGNGTAVGQCEWAAAPGPTQNGDGNGAWIPTGTPNGVCELRGPLGTAVGGGGQRERVGRAGMGAGRAAMELGGQQWGRGAAMGLGGGRNGFYGGAAMGLGGAAMSSMGAGGEGWGLRGTNRGGGE